MAIEDRVKDLENEPHHLKEKSKDGWDKFGVIAAALIPMAIAGVGGTYSYWSQKAETEVAKIRSASEHKIKQAELVSKFFAPLTGSDDEKKKFAAESLLVAAPDYGPLLVRIVAKNAKGSPAGEQIQASLNKLRDSLIRQMFEEDADQRKSATQNLLATWGADESLIPALLNYGSDNKNNLNGIYNTLVLLSHMQRDTIKQRKDEILNFALSVESNGRKTKERADILRERLK